MIAPLVNGQTLGESTLLDTNQVLRAHMIEIPATSVNAENFKGDPLGNAPAELNGYEGKFVLLNFWATWCTPCLTEMPDLNQLHKQLSPANFTVLAVAMGQEKKLIEGFVSKQNFAFPVLADPDMKISELYGVRSLPTTYLITPDRKIIGRALGPREWSEQTLTRLFAQLARQPSGDGS